MTKERALEIIQAALYADPLNDAVRDVKIALKSLEPLEAALLLGISAGVPIQVYREFGFWQISMLVRQAAKHFTDELDKTYG